VRHDQGSAVTIGAYDGVHLGHRRVIELLRGRAAAEGLRSVVVTFDRHPAAVVHPSSAPPLLTDAAQKLDLLQATGVDQVLVLRFDAERATEPAEDFVNEVLVAELGARVVVVGDDFHFGHERRGNVALLRSMGADAGFTVEPVHLIEDDAEHEIVSSTRIRALVAKGELDHAAALLGRPHEVRGRISVPDSDGVFGVDVPEPVLLPPAGTYDGHAGLVGGSLVPARLAVVAHLDGGPQRIDVALAEPADQLLLGGAEGAAVRVRFG
jgi:riboflavin kinase/FMN adenylyltransferase